MEWVNGERLRSASVSMSDMESSNVPQKGLGGGASSSSGGREYYGPGSGVLRGDSAAAQRPAATRGSGGTSEDLLLVEVCETREKAVINTLSLGSLTRESIVCLCAEAQVGVRCSLEQMLEEGFYHADPHPGRATKWTSIVSTVRCGNSEVCISLSHRKPSQNA